MLKNFALHNWPLQAPLALGRTTSASGPKVRDHKGSHQLRTQAPGSSQSAKQIVLPLNLLEKQARSCVHSKNLKHDSGTNLCPYRVTEWNDSMEPKWSSCDHNSLTLYTGTPGLRKGRSFQEVLFWVGGTVPWSLGFASPMERCWCVPHGPHPGGVLLEFSAQVVHLQDAHQGPLQQHGVVFTRRDWGGQRVFYCKRRALGFCPGFLPVCCDYCHISGPLFLIV